MPGTTPARCGIHLGRVRRRSILTDDLTNELAELLECGNYVETALAAVGLGKATFYEWLDRGDPQATKPADAPYRAFRARIERARAKGEAHNVEAIAEAAGEDWRAAAWMLERQFPDRWGRPSQRPSPGGQPVAPAAVTTAAPEGEEGEGAATVTALDAIRRRASAAGR